MDLPIRSRTSMEELKERKLAKAPFSSVPELAMTQWLDESSKDGPWLYTVEPEINNGARLSHSLSPNHVSEAETPSLSYGSSHKEEDQLSAGYLEFFSSRAAEVLDLDEQTDGEDRGPRDESRSSNTLGKEADTGKSKGKRVAPMSCPVSNSQDDPHKQLSEPKRLKVARPPTRAGGRFFACLFFKRDPNYCQNTHCAGRSTPSAETVIRGDLDVETHKTIKDMKKQYNMSIPGQDEELWIASYMTLFRVNRSDVPNPFVSPDVDDLSTVLARRLKQQPAFATELVTFFDQDAAMRHRHEEGREAIRHNFEATEAQRVEQARVETRAELASATRQHEESCRHERESFRNKFKASLAAEVSPDVVQDIEGDGIPAHSESQELRGPIDNTWMGASIEHLRPYDAHPTSDVNITDSGYGSNETYCFNCNSMSYIDSEGSCVGCQLLQLFE
ncbi:MAG: hypothetical protein Q9210_001204 [Variospora velana]